MSKMKRRVEVSLCMIVKDEEHYLDDCLASVQNVVDEMIIVDTGSMDDTLEIARHYGASIYHAEWSDNFAEARNESLRYATGRWILYLDADERLSGDSREAVQRVVSDCSKPYVTVEIHNLDANGQAAQITSAHRLFRKVPGVRFSGAVHESVAPFFQEMNCPEHFSDIRITHLGYAKSAEEMHRKEVRNRLLLRRQLKDEPDNPVWHYFLAQNFILAQQFEKALPVLDAALKLNELPGDMRLSAYNNLAEVHLNLGNFAAAIAFAEKSLARNPRQVMAYLLLFRIYRQQSDISNQIFCLEKVLSNLEAQETRTGSCLSIEAKVRPALIHINLGRLYVGKGLPDKARESFARAVCLEPRNVTAISNLSETLITLKRFGEAGDLLKTVNFSTISEPTILQRFAWLTIKCGADSLAITCLTRLEQMLPDASEVRRRLAGLYHKNGDSERARQYLAPIQRGHSSTP